MITKRGFILRGSCFCEKFNGLHLLQLTVCDNLLSSMRVVLNGMGQLHINLEHPRNKVCQAEHSHSILKLLDDLIAILL